MSEPLTKLSVNYRAVKDETMEPIRLNPTAQSRKMSGLEALTNSAIGFGISVMMWMLIIPLIFGAPASFGQSAASTAIFTVISIARFYVVRRLFTWLHHTRGVN